MRVGILHHLKARGAQGRNGIGREAFHQIDLPTAECRNARRAIWDGQQNRTRCLRDAVRVPIIAISLQIRALARRDISHLIRTRAGGVERKALPITTKRLPMRGRGKPNKCELEGQGRIYGARSNRDAVRAKLFIAADGGNTATHQG